MLAVYTAARTHRTAGGSGRGSGSPLASTVGSWRTTTATGNLGDVLFFGAPGRSRRGVFGRVIRHGEPASTCSLETRTAALERDREDAIAARRRRGARADRARAARRRRARVSVMVVQADGGRAAARRATRRRRERRSTTIEHDGRAGARRDAPAARDAARRPTSEPRSAPQPGLAQLDDARGRGARGRAAGRARGRGRAGDAAAGRRPLRVPDRPGGADERAQARRRRARARVCVRLRRRTTLELEVVDDGRGAAAPRGDGAATA